MIGILFIILGIILGLITMRKLVFYLPFGMLFAILTSIEWGKNILHEAGLRQSDLYLWFAAGMMLVYGLYRLGGEDDDHVTLASIVGGIIIASLFVLFGMIMMPSMVPFVTENILPLLEWMSLHIAMVFALPAIIILFALLI